ncbi:PAS domain-containing sensor histidine kinase [Palleniella muris]|uniref:PAS domain-containing sensor histidine kinase n=1 Tax=Palleniella muris TaxID=3038145 RepID=A0AC61QNP0_9BACT|nr:ATP-binding protein [Palleniella muris]TGX81383.1 PAS domain-containing sensor histidine kinase [Palleniella muris]
MWYAIGTLAAINALILTYYYFKVWKPMRTIANGIDLLHEQDFSSRLAPVGERQADRLVAMFNEMMDSLKNEHLKLEEQNFFLTQLIKVSPMGVVVYDYDGNETMRNAAAERLLSEGGSTLQRELTGMRRGEETTIRLSDSQIYRCFRMSFTDRGFARQFLLIESLTEEVVAAERRAYEKVIRMIAHEVNNTMAGVGSILDTLQQLSDEEEKELMAVCVDRCHSMSRFITRFADVVKIPEAVTKDSEIRSFILSRSKFLESLCSPRNIRLVFRLGNEDITAPIDESLFEQVLTNIVKNSAESIGQDGTITIGLHGRTLEIIDNGHGISPEVEQKLFSPFFSTKPDGQGIGLIFVRDVLRKHHFRFSLHTDQEDGLTHFRIHL